MDITVVRRTFTVASLLLLLLGSQFFFFAVLWLYDPRVRLATLATSYAVMLLLEAVQRIVDHRQRTRILTSIAACNSICLFFGTTGEPWPIVPLAVVAWLSRRFLVREGRHLFNPGTFAILCGGALSIYGAGLGGELVPISHGFNTVPQFSALVIALGTGLAWIGGHLGLVAALVAGFGITRGLPNAAELVIFFFAAPDPVTVPRRPHARVAFGFLAGVLTGLLWIASSSPATGEIGRQLLGNELIKVGGLVLVGAVSGLFRDLDYEGALRRWAGAAGAARTWSQPAPRAAVAAALLAYAAIVNRGYPYHAIEVEVRLVDLRSGLPLDAQAAEAFHRRQILVNFEGDQVRAFWSAVHGAWSPEYRWPGGARAAPGKEITVHLAPACRPGLTLAGPPYVGRARSVPLLKAGRLAVTDKYVIVVPVDVAAVTALCSHPSDDAAGDSAAASGRGAPIRKSPTLRVGASP